MTMLYYAIGEFSSLFASFEANGEVCFREWSMPSERLVLFIDAQNFYHGARQAFFNDSDWHIYGQFNPVKLGELICSRAPVGKTRLLHEVRVYTGRPDSEKEPSTHAAHMRQCAAWEKAGTTVIHRTLRYPADWPNSKAQQKGVDVALAIDFIAFAIDDKYDVGVIASTDSDLKPALEFVYDRFATGHYVEVAAWKSSVAPKRLSIPRAHIWCYWLDKGD